MDRSDFKYWPYYCEENIWHLCQDPRLRAVSNMVVFISNDARKCAIAEQRAGSDGLVIWDYHVVLLNRSMIWDLDTLLSFPCPAGDYLKKSFLLEFDDDYLPRFRVIKAETYIRNFTSDRRHMINQSGKYIHSPPHWPAIRPEEGSNLFSLVDMRRPFMGETYSLSDLIKEIDHKN